MVARAMRAIRWRAPWCGHEAGTPRARAPSPSAWRQQCPELGRADSVNFRDERHPVYGIAPVGRVCRNRLIGAALWLVAITFAVLSLLVGGR